jgi:hypothetical protein
MGNLTGMNHSKLSILNIADGPILKLVDLGSSQMRTAICVVWRESLKTANSRGAKKYRR